MSKLLPTSIPARNVIPPIITQQIARNALSTPQVARNVNVNLDPISEKVKNNKLLNSLNRLSEPITRLQDLGSNASNLVRGTVENLVPVNPLQTMIGTRVADSVNKVTNAVSNTLRLPAISSLGSEAIGKIASIPNNVMSLGSRTSGILQSSGLNVGNATLGIAAGGLLLCGVLASLLKIDINSLLSQMMQMQRTALAKLDNAIAEVLDVIKKKVDEFLALIPKVVLPSDFDKYARMIEDKFRSVVAQISKFTSKINDVLQKASDCLQGLNSILGMVGLLGGLFGLSNVLGCSNVQKLRNYSNLGNISNVNHEIGRVFPELVNNSMRKQVETNRKVAEKDLDYAHDQFNEEIKKQCQQMTEQVAEEALDNSLSDEINDFIDYANDVINDLNQYIDALIQEIKERMQLDPSDPRYISPAEGNQIINALEELKNKLNELLEEIKRLADLPESNNDLIADNLKKMTDTFNEIKNDIDETLTEQQENLDDIYNELETNADLIDAETITQEPQDTSCKT